MAGLQPTASGIRFRPSLPASLGRWELKTALMGASWDGGGVWKGHYAPHAAGEWRLEVDLSLVMADTTSMEVTLTAVRDDAEHCVHGGACEAVVTAQVKAMGGLAQVHLPVRARQVVWLVRALRA